jgi:hypothetical protein
MKFDRGAYTLEDWALAAGIVLFVLLAAGSGFAGRGFGGLLWAALAAVCAFFLGARAERRKLAKVMPTPPTLASPPAGAQ